MKEEPPGWGYVYEISYYRLKKLFILDKAARDSIHSEPVKLSVEQ